MPSPVHMSLIQSFEGLKRTQKVKTELTVCELSSAFGLTLELHLQLFWFSSLQPHHQLYAISSPGFPACRQYILLILFLWRTQDNDPGILDLPNSSLGCSNGQPVKKLRFNFNFFHVCLRRINCLLENSFRWLILW